MPSYNLWAITWQNKNNSNSSEYLTPQSLTVSGHTDMVHDYYSRQL